MATVVTDGLRVCVDCALLIANGEVTDSDGNDIAEQVAERQVAVWGNDARWLVLTDYDEPFFSWSDCEGCGSTLGGDRMLAAVIR